MKRIMLVLLLLCVLLITGCIPHIPSEKMPPRITDSPPPTTIPTMVPTEMPTLAPTATPTPTQVPTSAPTATPTPEPTETPTPVPTEEPAIYGHYHHKSTTKKDTELVDLRLVIPNIIIYQIFGTDQNFTGQVLYENPVPVLQKGTALKLKKAAELFAKDGYTIKIYDCYRPKTVQYILYDIVQNSSYIANPYNGASKHNRATAIDMVLVDKDGNELDFPTPMHTFADEARRDYSYLWTAEQCDNVDYMTNIMLQCGFDTIKSEWWHFADVKAHDYEVLSIDMQDIQRYTATMYPASWD